ncbi:MAG: dephospho-CoA kinase [Cocleimonas sp.]|nr:dephospho-CoA kinase [Cocleimonas sp.]
MIKIGLTGGIGCGKSTVTQAFSDKGVTIIDADKIAYEMVAPNTMALNEIIAIFGVSVLQKDGSLDRHILKKLIFSDKEKLKQLEAILHPKIYHTIKNRLAESESLVLKMPYIIADIPLLIEKNYVDLFDYIVVVDCFVEQQIQRICQRDDMSITIIKSIINKQVSRTTRLKQATHILDNSGSKAKLLLQVNSLHEDLILDG